MIKVKLDKALYILKEKGFLYLIAFIVKKVWFRFVLLVRWFRYSSSKPQKIRRRGPMPYPIRKKNPGILWDPERDREFLRGVISKLKSTLLND